MKARILAAGQLLGILQQDPQQWLQGASSETLFLLQEIEALIAERQEAKLAKNYARADEIRQELLRRVWFWRIPARAPSGSASD